jgi:polysaccharide deacetylase family protein (PEP-CTERM system associated)
MNHALSVDVEDDFNIGMYDLFGIKLPPSARVVRNTERLLNIFQECGVHGTFFVLGEVAKSFPFLVKKISNNGHEVGVHGFHHIQFFRLDKKAAIESLRTAKHIIEDTTGRKVLGHRAPAFSIRPDTAWALETLVEVGFQYDSSIVPCKGRRYGWPRASKSINALKLAGGNMIIEAPLTTVNLFGKGVLVCGGGYLRHFPFIVTKWAMRLLKNDRSVIVYVHPYDIDMDPLPSEFQMHLNRAGTKIRRHIGLQVRNRKTVEHKLRKLFSMATFQPMADVIEEQLCHSFNRS